MLSSTVARSLPLTAQKRSQLICLVMKLVMTTEVAIDRSKRGAPGFTRFGVASMSRIQNASTHEVMIGRRCFHYRLDPTAMGAAEQHS